MRVSLESRRSAPPREGVPAARSDHGQRIGVETHVRFGARGNELGGCFDARHHGLEIKAGAKPPVASHEHDGLRLFLSTVERRLDGLEHRVAQRVGLAVIHPQERDTVAQLIAQQVRHFDSWLAQIGRGSLGACVPRPSSWTRSRARSREREIDGDTLVHQTAATIFPMSEAASAQLTHALMGSEPPTGYDMRGTLGEGGTGVVRLAEQRSLGRRVAVKMLRPDSATPSATEDLLREAWVTGALEHPNIVPVHEIAIDETGAPMVILKEIKGTDWSSLIHDSDASATHRGESDQLEWNLRVLISVCDAVHFAHSRGVLHRDLKPENVMLGEHGEVYVVDWGLAVAFGDDHDGRLPLAADANHLAGTPAYMAPEMLGGLGDLLSPRTDIYLLGAVLFHIVTGAAPHSGQTLVELVRRITATPPNIPDDVPAELATLILEAMHFDPVERPESALVFRHRLESFLRHRDASRLTEHAEEELERLVALSAADGPDRDALYNAYGECRYGFRHALELWPESRAAREGLARAVEVMVGFELARAEPRTAETLLSAHPEPPTELQERVRDALAREKQESSALTALRDAMDPRRSRRLRYMLAAAFAVMFVVQPVVTGVLHHQGTVPARNETAFAANAVAFVIFSALGWWQRQSLRESHINRVVIVALITAIGANALLRGIDVATTNDVMRATGQQMLVWAAILVMVATLVDRWFLIPTAVYAVGYLAAGLFPSLAYLGVATGNMVLVVTALVVTARASSPVPPSQHEV